MWFAHCVIALALSTSALAGGGIYDARVWVPSEDQEHIDASHADRGFDFEAFYANDSSAPNPMAAGALLGVHYRVLTISEGWMFERALRLGAIVSSNPQPKGAPDNGSANMLTGYILQASGEAARLFCLNKKSCFFVGGMMGTGYTPTDGDTHPTPYVSNNVLQTDAETGFIYSKNNKSLILKFIGGVSGDGQKNFYGYRRNPDASKDSGTGFEFYGEFGGSAELLLGNKLWILASVIRRLGLMNGINEQTEGRLRVNARLWGVPIDTGSNPGFFKGLYLEFDAKYIDATMVGPDSGYYGVPPSNVHVKSFVGEGGLVIEY